MSIPPPPSPDRDHDPHDGTSLHGTEADRELSMPDWLYIAGRGYSGSTLLDAMLGNAPGIESVGELVSGMAQPEGECSCGETFMACPYWTAVRDRFEKDRGTSWSEASRAVVRQAHLFRYPRTLLSPKSDRWAQSLIRDMDGLKWAIDADATYIVDSSKEVTRALFLLRHDPDAKLIHLVRHPAFVLESYYRRLRAGRPFKLLRKRFYPERSFAVPLLLAGAGWTVGNALVELARILHRKRVLRIRYEDLISSPHQTLDRIGDFLGADLGELKSRIDENGYFEIGHNIGGNQMRMKGSFRLNRNDARRTDLPRQYRIMVAVVCSPLMLYYGYLSRRQKPAHCPQPST